jgi:hypothetical protein
MPVPAIGTPVMKMTKKHFILILALVVAAFGVGIYLQDLQHQKSTQAAWQANRENLARFNRIRAQTFQMDDSNWESARDSIKQELDSFRILRFRKEMDSLNKLKE